MHRKDVLLGVVVVLVLVVVVLVSCCLFSADPSSNSAVMWLAVAASGLVLAAGGIASWDENAHKVHDTDVLRKAAASTQRRGSISLADLGIGAENRDDDNRDDNEYSYYGA